MMNAPSLRTKFLIGSLGLVILLGLAVIVFVRTELMNSLQAELQKRGFSIAKEFAENAVHPLLTEDVFHLRMIALEHKRSEEDIEYLFVENTKGDVLAHTFGEKFPAGLRKANPVRAGQAYSIRLLVTEKGDVFDIATPILKGDLGTVHVGISAGPVRKSVAGIIRHIVWIIIGVVAFGSVIVIIFTARIMKPLKEVADAAKTLGSGDMTRRVVVRTNDELGQLAARFNKMGDDLLSTTVSSVHLERLVEERTAEIAKTNAKLQALVQALEHLSRQKELILNSAGEGIYGLDSAGVITFVNPAAANMLGWRVEEITGRPSHALFHHSRPDGSPYPGEECPFHKALVSGEAHQVLGEVFWRRDGTSFPVEYISTPIRENGAVVGAVVVFKDIAERRQIEAALKTAVVNAKEEKAKTDAIIAAIGDGISIQDINHKILYQNQVAKNLLGQHVGEYCYQAYQNRDRVCERCHLTMAFTDGKVHKLEQKRTTDKGAFYYEIKASPLRDASGTIVAGIELIREVTDQKAAEEALRSNEERLSRGQRIAHVGDWEWDLATNAVHWSDELYRIYGYAPREVSPDYGLVVNAMHPDSREKFLTAIDAALKERKPFEMDYTFFRKDGSTAVLHTIGKLVLGADGKPERMLGTVQDVTERKQNEKALLESEEKYRLLVEAANSVILRWDTAGNIQFMNDYGNRFFGFRADELIGRNVVGTIVPRAESAGRDLAHLMEKIQRDPDTFKDNESKNMTKDGRRVWVRWANKAIMDEHRALTGILSIGHDITDRKRAETVLQQQRIQLDEAQRIAHVGSWERDVVSNRVIWSDEFYRIIGFNPGEIEPSYDQLLNMIHPDDREGFMKAGKEAVYERKPYSVDYRVIRRNGSTAVIHASGEVVYDRSGAPALFRGTAQDITERKLAEEALYKTNETLNSLIRYSPLAIVCIDPESNVMIWNPAAERIFGWTEEEVLGRKNPIVPEDREKEYRQLTDTVRKGEPYLAKELVRRKKDGTLIHLSASSAAIHDAGGKAVASFALFQDVTERHKMEAALRKSEENYRALLEQASDGIAVIDQQGRYLDVNSRMCALMGYSRGEFLKLRITDVVAPGEMSTTNPSRLPDLLEGKTVISERIMLRKDGSTFPMEISAKMIPDGRLCGIHRDITERKKTEAALTAAVVKANEEKARSEAIISAIGDSLVVISPDFTVLYQNRLDREIMGDVVGKRCYKAFENRTSVCEDCPVEPALWDGKIHRGVRVATTKAGVLHMDITASPLLDASGKVIAVIELVKDITERKRAEELVRESQEKYKNLVELTTDIIYLSDKNGNQVFMNDEAFKVLEYSPRDVIGKPWSVLVHPDDREASFKAFAAMIERNIDTFNFESRYVTKSGKAINALHNVRILRNEQGEIVGTQGIARDITQRKQVEDRLKLYSQAMEEATDGVQIVDLDGRIVYSNKALEEMCGYGAGELTGRHVNEMSVEKELSTRVIIPEIMKTGRWGGEVMSVRKDGSQFPIWLSTALVRNEKGDPIAMVGIIRDITERRQAEAALRRSHIELEVLVQERTAELRMINEQLSMFSSYLQEARERERTSIAREIHDELGQALTALKMDLSWLRKRLPKNQKPLLEKEKSMSELVESTIQTVKKISSELRPGILDHLGLTAAIEWQADDFQKRTGTRCSVSIVPEEIAPDRERSTVIFRIFQETLTNIARHAKATKISVTLEQEGAGLVLEVRDNGRGISEEQLADPRSLGLMGIRERAAYCGGTVSIKGARNRGTTVTVHIPLGPGGGVA